ncbi:glycosyltransferase family 2 protein [Bacillus cereus]|uniref:glycosyltransferase family 2 protein n=1 Tax=Bacillus cereus TaxID=1396 RepID=UPI0024BCF45D|nr:glycosyltransferase family 2 protein [Bacillus cereus]WHT91517.1 hypothetical protein QM226_001762 [Bacillus cereus]
MTFVIILKIVLLLEVLIMCGAIKNYININKTIKNTKIYRYGEEDVNFSIFLPCHKEYNLIEETLLYFNNFTKSHNTSVFVIVATELESNGKKVKEDSYTRCLDFIKNNNLSIKVIFDETISSTKTSKLSFALNSINKIPKNTYIGVYDFDARPHKNTINWIANDICYRKGDMPTVYQQIPYVIQNVNTKTPKVIDLLSIWHIRRSLGIEGYNFFSKKSKKDIFYLMGSGMYIRVDELLNVGGFPDYSDDIALGYRFYLLNKKQVIIPYPAIVSGLNNLKDYFNQITRIYYGIFSIREQYKYLTLNGIKVTKTNYFMKFIYSIFDVTREVILLISLLLSVYITKSIIALIICLTLLLLKYLVYNILFNKIKYDWIENSNKYNWNRKIVHILKNTLIGFTLNIPFRTLALLNFILKKGSLESKFFLSSNKEKI